MRTWRNVDSTELVVNIQLDTGQAVMTLGSHFDTTLSGTDFLSKYDIYFIWSASITRDDPEWISRSRLD